METTITAITLEVDSMEDMDAIRKEAKLMAHLHGWDDIHPEEIHDWAVEVKEDEDFPAQNPLYG
jgi:hypothetical protein